MANARFFTARQGCVLADFEDLPAVKALRGDRACVIDNAAELDDPEPGKAIGYIAQASYVSLLKDTRIAAVVCHEDVLKHIPDHLSVLVSEKPRLSYAHLLTSLYPEVHDTVSVRTADIDPTAEIGENVKLGKGVLIGKRARIGQGTQIGDYSIVGDHCVLGNDCRIGRHNSMHYSLIGDGFVCHDQNTIGCAGFAFEPTAEGMFLMPQLGLVRIGHGVRLASLNIVARGALGDTVIKDHVQIESQCNVGHNVNIGLGAVIVGQCAIAGSAHIGNYVQMAGQVGVKGFTRIGDFAKIMACTAVTKDVDANETIFGVPGMKLREFGMKQKEIQKLVTRTKKKIKD